MRPKQTPKAAHDDLLARVTVDTTVQPQIRPWERRLPDRRQAVGDGDPEIGQAGQGA